MKNGFYRSHESWYLYVSNSSGNSEFSISMGAETYDWITAGIGMTVNVT